MVHLNYAINIWLFLNNKGSHTTSRHKKEEMIKKSGYGSHMAGLEERSLCVEAAEPSNGACEAIRGKESTQLSLSSSSPSSTEPSVCQDKQMRRHMLERLLEYYWESFCSWSRWKEICNHVVFIPLHTVIVSYFLFSLPLLGFKESQECIN